MGSLEIFFFFFFFLLLFFPVTYAPCPTSMCGNNGLSIRFPFQLESQQPENCSYPGFVLSCSTSDQNITVLKLPYSGEFFVRDIDYAMQQIQVFDPDNCLPKRLLDFNLSGSPFMAVYYQNYTFLSCPTQLIRSRLTAIDCLSNSTTSVLATSSMTLARSMSENCKTIVTLPIPIPWPVQYEDGFSSDLNYDLQLTWNVPNCRYCETEGGLCGFKCNNSQEIGCFYNPGTGNSSQSTDGLHIFKIIVLSVTIPAMTCAVGVAFFMCFMDRRGRTQRASTPTAISPQPPAILMTGLDESTIETHTMVVLGESLRLPGPNDSTCPICLSEYCAKETLRCIPKCEHCFHAVCIDEWLRLNSTCPVCRISLSPYFC